MMKFLAERRFAQAEAAIEAFRVSNGLPEALVTPSRRKGEVRVFPKGHTLFLQEEDRPYEMWLKAAVAKGMHREYSSLPCFEFELKLDCKMTIVVVGPVGYDMCE